MVGEAAFFEPPRSQSIKGNSTPILGVGTEKEISDVFGLPESAPRSGLRGSLIAGSLML